MKKILFFTALFFCFTPLLSPARALLLGLIMAQVIGHPYPTYNHSITQTLLKVSVIGLGFGMNITNAIEVGKDVFFLTLISITALLGLGYIIGKILKIEKHLSYLISVGTAICGGSAIAAISPVIRAKENQISIAIGIIFILNSIALFVFPFIGTSLNLTQTQFGMWCAIAIHDTSSVVGAADQYGAVALEVATTVKLSRALWIIPVAFLSSFLFKSDERKVKIPYFIGLFIVAMCINSYVPFVQEINHYIIDLAKIGLTVTLFLIGCGLNKKVIMSVGFRPLIQGVIQWLLITLATLWIVQNYF